MNRPIQGQLCKTLRHPQNRKYITYHIVAREGSLGHRQYVQKFVSSAVWFSNYTSREWTDGQTDKCEVITDDIGPTVLVY